MFAMKSGIFYTISARLLRTSLTLCDTMNPLRPKERRGFDWFYTVGGNPPCPTGGYRGSFGELGHRLKREFVAKEPRFADCRDQRLRVFMDRRHSKQGNNAA